MTPRDALNILDETVTGNLELKVVLSKALEKQIPKRTKRDTNNEEIKAFVVDAFGFCPICDNAFECYEDYSCPYCPECGQALDWSDT